jgi:hypothetical protein
VALASRRARYRVRNRNADWQSRHEDLILVWGKQRRIVAGADLLGRLLRGMVMTEAKAQQMTGGSP